MEKEVKETKKPAKPAKTSAIGRKIMKLELGKPLEILGNAKTLSHKEGQMVICETGVLAQSKKTGREVHIWAADCGAAILMPEEVDKPGASS